MNEGSSHEARSANAPGYIVSGDPGRTGGGTYTMPTTQARAEPTLQDYENIFGELRSQGLALLLF